LWHVAYWLVIAAYVALVVALLSGWPDNRGADRIPVEIGEPLICGTYGCEEVDGNGG
jgi:hypothetical protein